LEIQRGIAKAGIVQNFVATGMCRNFDCVVLNFYSSAPLSGALVYGLMFRGGFAVETRGNLSSCFLLIIAYLFVLVIYC